MINRITRTKALINNDQAMTQYLLAKQLRLEVSRHNKEIVAINKLFIFGTSLILLCLALVNSVVQ